MPTSLRAPLFGHLRLERAAVEVASRTSWLLEPDIRYTRRATRSVAEVLTVAGSTQGRRGAAVSSTF